MGVASSAAAQGIGGAITPLAVWSGFWALAAVLFLLPDNRTRDLGPRAPSSGMASGEPGWYSHFLTNFGNLFSTDGHPDGLDPGHGLGGHRRSALGGPPSRVVPRRRRPARRPVVDHRPGSGGKRPHRLGDRPEHGTAGDPAGPGHGAHGRRVAGGLAFARRRRAAAEPGGRPSSVSAGLGAALGPERQLPRRGGGVDDGMAMAGMRWPAAAARRDGIAVTVGHRRAPACRTRSASKIAGLDLANTPLHDHGGDAAE